MIAGINAYRAPAIIPAIHAMSSMSNEGPGSFNATIAATIVPVTICPSTPILMYPARHDTAVASAQMMIGVARVNVSAR